MPVDVACTGLACMNGGTALASLAIGAAGIGAVIYGTVVDPLFFGKVPDMLPDISTVQGVKQSVSSVVQVAVKATEEGVKGVQKAARKAHEDGVKEVQKARQARPAPAKSKSPDAGWEKL